jgi:predicted dehydrogenase
MIGIGLYGLNGHQIQGLLGGHARARLVATAGLDPARLPEPLRGDRTVRHCATLAELLRTPHLDLVSLCSPRRRDQAADAIACLAAGKHVYAEKPCAMSEADLDAVLAAATASGCRFHEMADTAFGQPYLAMRELVAGGALGEVVQVFAQKSYPYHDGRPQDEDVDGGLIGQNAIHAVRMVEQVGGQRIAAVRALETTHGNPVAGGGLRLAASLHGRLANGGLFTVIANYLNQKGMGSWGNEHLRVFGTHGFVEAVDGGARTRAVIGERDLGPLDTSRPGLSWFECFLDELEGRGSFPLSLADELHPTRVVIRAKAAAAAAG